ncbi:MAG: TetR family transcriptional regulator [Flammeovirgaceae bacterium]
MGRKSLKEVRRQEIVKAFYKTAKKEGLHNTSIAKIAEVMDVNPSLILHYFKDKNDLILALIDYILDRYQKIYVIAKKEKPIDELKGVIDNLFSRKWNSLISDDVYYNCYTLIFRNQEIRRKYKALHDELRASLEKRLTDCMEEGEIYIENPNLTASLIYTFLEGAYYYLCMEKDRTKQALAMEQYKAHIYQMLGLALPAVAAAEN